MMKIFLISLSVFLCSCAGYWPFAERDDFVTVRGTQFIHNDQPYYFLGTNLWYACYLGSPGVSGDRLRLIRELDSLHSMGITNVRLLAGSELSLMNRTLKPSITTAPGIFDDSLLLGLDFTLAELAKRKMKAVLFLTNYWEWSGGMAQYLVWADSVPTFNPDIDNWDVFMNFSATFYASEKANALFRSYVTKIITRKNAYNGRMYRDDPTIMSWQLANEPRPGADDTVGERNVTVFIEWIDKTAAHIKSLDTNHLVSSGSEGVIGCLRNEKYYRTAHSSPSVDYVTMHMWPSVWKWIDAKDQEGTFAFAMDSSINYLNTHFSIARIMNKPLVLEEFGMLRDSAAFSPSSLTTMRDRYYRNIFELVYDSARNGAPIAGANFWAWGGEGRSLHSDFMWSEGDPLTGDPAHEPQGMHSVFNTDSSTIAIIRYYAFKMKSLGKDDALLVHRVSNSQ